MVRRHLYLRPNVPLLKVQVNYGVFVLSHNHPSHPGPVCVSKDRGIHQNGALTLGYLPATYCLPSQ